MSLLERWRPPPNLTRDWVRDPTVKLQLDLDAHTLNGTGLGGSFSELCYLGPAKVDSTQSRYEFQEGGVVIETRTCGGNEIETIYVVTIPDKYFPGFQPFSGSIRLNGNESMTAP